MRCEQSDKDQRDPCHQHIGIRQSAGKVDQVEHKHHANQGADGRSRTAQENPQKREDRVVDRRKAGANIPKEQRVSGPGNARDGARHNQSLQF